MKEFKEESSYRRFKKKQLESIGYYLFSHFGLKKVTMRTLAKEAEISPGLTYSYYADKYELLDCILERYIKSFSEEIEEEKSIIDSEEKFWQDLMEFLTKIKSFNQLFRIFMFIDLEHYEATTYKEQINKVIDSKLKEFCEYKSFKNDEAEDFRFYMKGFMNAIVLNPEEKSVQRLMVILKKYYGRE